MLISIVIPVLNQCEYLEEAILSVLNQDHLEKELIIIDGGSQDGTLAIIEQYGSSIAYWVSEPDFGQSDAIKKGMEKAQGEIVNWLNADDYLLPNALSRIHEAFVNSNAEVVCSKVLRQRQGVGMENEISQTRLERCTEKTIAYCSMGQPGQFYLRRVWNLLGGVSLEYNYSMDKDLWIRYLIKFGQSKVKVVDFESAIFRVHPGSKTSSNVEGFEREDRRIEEMFFQQIQFSGNLMLLQSYFKGKAAVKAYINSNYQESRKLAWKAITGGAIDSKGLLLCFLKVLLFPGFLINLIRKIK